MAEVYLKDLVHARSGDKGDISNICLFARDPVDYPMLKQVLTPEKVKEHFGERVQGNVVRYDIDTLNGFNFVLYHALGGGATMSLRLDSLGKSMASALLRMKIEKDG